MGRRATTFTFNVGSQGAVSARIYRARDPIEATFLFAHGAGAPQTHPFIVDMATRLSARGIDVVTFNFLYSERQRRMPDRNDVLEVCWHAAIASVRARSGLPTERLYCGGKSMGGRIASQVAAAGEGLALSGLVFFGYPLHAPGKSRARRDAHLGQVPFPMLFVQGSKDALGNEKDMRALVAKLPNARLHLVPGADHSLALPKREGEAKQEAALAAAAHAVVRFIGGRSV